MNYRNDKRDDEDGDSWEDDEWEEEEWEDDDDDYGVDVGDPEDEIVEQ